MIIIGIKKKNSIIHIIGAIGFFAISSGDIATLSPQKIGIIAKSE
jgi:hypothetical protein